jgi:hypothetical protein
MPDERDKLKDLWEKRAIEELKGKKIVKVRYMTGKESSDMGWGYKGRAIVLILDDGTMLLPSVDPEGNGPGVLFTNIPNLLTIPSL